MQVTSVSCVAAVQWPTPFHDCVSGGRGNNVCYGEMFAVMMHVYTVIVLYNTYTAVKIVLLCAGVA